MIDPSKLTWTCHVCGEERPDAQISVAKYHAIHERVPVGYNVRYCNDRPDCAAGTEPVAQRWSGKVPVKPGPAPRSLYEVLGEPVTQEQLDRLNEGTGFTTPQLPDE